MSKILVTGGAGFIGAHTARKLQERGEKVVIIDDFDDRYDPRLKEARVENLLLADPPAKIIRGDICDRNLIEKTFTEEKFDTVIHLAAWAAVTPSIKLPHIFTAVNVDGTVNLLDAACHNGIKSFVFASSSSVYGGQTHVPFKEDGDITHPISPYAATKAAGEIMCATWHHLYQMPIAALRFFTVYGPWGRPEMAVFQFAHALLNQQTIQMRGRNTSRDFTYIDDCVQGIISAHDHPQGFQIFNLGESDAVPLPRLIAALEHSLSKQALVEEVPLPDGEVPTTLADISKAKQLLNYEPKTSIESGIGQFASWYLDWYVPRFG